VLVGPPKNNNNNNKHFSELPHIMAGKRLA